MPNALYASTAVQSERSGEDSALSSFTATDRLCHSGGLRIAAMGLAAEHGAASFAFRKVMALPVQISVSQRDIQPGDRITLRSRLRHQGRSILLTEMEALRGSGTSCRVGFGSILWSVIGAAPVERPPSRPLSEWPVAGRDMLAIAGVTASASESRIEGIAPDVAGPGGILHAGAMQVLMEEEALALVARVGHDRKALHVADAAFHFVRAAREGAFVARARPLHSSADGYDVETEVFDQNGTGRLCAISRTRVGVIQR